MESVPDISDAVRIASGFQIIVYNYVPMLALLVYDWLILLDHEVEYVWRSEWSIPKILFIIARYGTFLDMPILVTVLVVPYGAMDSNTCNILFKIAGWSMFLGASISQSILLLRTIAIYSRSKRILIPLSITYAAGTVAGIVITWHYLRTMSISAPSVPWLSGCSLKDTGGKILVQSNFLILLVFEFVVVILTIGKMSSDFHSGTPLLRVIYRDSIGFFLVLFVLTLSAILAHMLVPPHFYNLLVGSVRVTHSIVCCRILLNLRRAASPKGGSVTTRTISLTFATAPGLERNQADTIRLDSEVYGVQSHEDDSRHGDFVV